MRVLAYVTVAAGLTACQGEAIDAGNNGDAGSPSTEQQATDGGTVIASRIQLPPVNMLSDGKTLFWNDDRGNVSSMPVNGGTITTLADEQYADPPGFTVMAVDETGLYVSGVANGTVANAVGYLDLMARIPKDGGAPVDYYNPSPATFTAPTVLGEQVYWAEWNEVGSSSNTQSSGPLYVKTRPLHGGQATIAYQFTLDSNSLDEIRGVFVSSKTPFFIVDFSTPPVINAPAGPELVPLVPTADGGNDQFGINELGGFTNVQQCDSVLSDESEIICGNSQGIFSISGQLSPHSHFFTGSGIASVVADHLPQGALTMDDTNVYWVNNLTVGTVMKARKTGGPAAVLAWDTNPIAIAVDAKNVYWSDANGHIMSIVK